MGFKVYLNGELVPEEEAKVSVFDHGLLYGDGIYESLQVRNGKVFKLREHIERLFRSARAIKLEVPLGPEALRETILETLRANGGRDLYLRVVVTRGPGYPLLDPRVTSGPTLAIIPHEPSPPPETGTSYRPRGSGLRLKSVSVRKTPSVSLDARIKSLNYLNNVLARIEAIESGFDEALLMDINGYVAECPGENIFLVKAGVLKTPRASQVLDGITRRTILELAAREGIPASEEDLTLYDLYNADEAFLSSSFGHVHPVAGVDGRPIEAPGPLTVRLKELCLKLEEEEGEPIFG